MNRKRRGIVYILAAAAMLTGLLGGCGDGQPAQTQSSPQGAAQYPVETDVTLTYWGNLNYNLTTQVKNFGDTPFAQEYQKRTGIKVEYKHPAQGQEAETLNLLIASGDLPDIVETNWYGQPAGPQNAIDVGTIISLNDILQNNAPNLKKFLDSNPDVDRMVKTDEGSYYCFPFIRNDDSLLSVQGFMLRADWLKELELDVPETMDEWYTVLKAFKEKKNSPAPLSILTTQLNAFMAPYHVAPSFYLDDGKVKYGPMEPGYKEFITTMKKWYEEGLIDRDFAVMDRKAYDSNMVSGRSGATFGAGGGGMGYYLNAVKGQDTTFDLVGAPFPVLQKGDTIEFGQKDTKYAPKAGAAITTSCENPVLAAYFLDYSYSEEGNMLNNFGIEGVSYTMEGDYPKYTEFITNNPDGTPMSQIMPMYLRASAEAPMIQDPRYLEQYYALPQQKQAVEVWKQNNMDKHNIPPVTYSQEESSEMGNITLELASFKDEMTLKFILGERSMDEYDQYLEQLKQLKVERAIEIMEKALERYSKR